MRKRGSRNGGSGTEIRRFRNPASETQVPINPRNNNATPAPSAIVSPYLDAASPSFSAISLSLSGLAFGMGALDRPSPQLSFTFIDKQNKFSLSFWSIFWNGISRLKLKKQNKGNWGWKKKKLRSGFKLFFVLSQMKVFSFTEQFRDEFERKTLFSHF